MLMLIIPRLVDSISVDSQVVAIHLFEESLTLSNWRQILNVNEDIQDYTNKPSPLWTSRDEGYNDYFKAEEKICSTF